MYTLPISFFFWTIIGQLVGISFGLLTVYITHSLALSLLIVSCLALTISSHKQMPLAWQALNFLLPFAIFTSLTVNLPSWIFLIAFLLFAVLHLPALWTRIPYYPTPQITYEYIFGLLPHEKEFKFLDIGCGMGDLLKFLASRSTNGTYVGVEIGLLPYLVSRVKNYSAANITVYFQSMWKMDFSEFDVIYAFLSPAPMEELWKKFSSEAKSGTLLISNSFEAPIEADNTIETGEEKGGTLYLYYKM